MLEGTTVSMSHVEEDVECCHCFRDQIGRCWLCIKDVACQGNRALSSLMLFNTDQNQPEITQRSSRYQIMIRKVQETIKRVPSHDVGLLISRVAFLLSLAAGLTQSTPLPTSPIHHSSLIDLLFHPINTYPRVQP